MSQLFGGLFFRLVGDVEKANENNALTVFEATKKRPGDKRKREKAGDPGEIEGYKGTALVFSGLVNLHMLDAISNRFSGFVFCKV